MQAYLLGYLLGALDVDETAIVEHLLAIDDELRRQLKVLRFAFTPLESGRQQIDVPENLAVRTCRLIRELQK